MKHQSFSRKQILRAIHAACIAIFLAASASHASATPSYSGEFEVNGVTVTVPGSADNPSTAFFSDPDPNGYAVTVQSGAIIGNTSGNLVAFDHGSVNNAGTMTSSHYTIVIAGNGNVTNSGYIGACTSGSTAVYIQGNGTVSNLSGATIKGQYGVDIDGQGTVTNDGTIIGKSGQGVYIGSGTVTNSGCISSRCDEGVEIDGNGTVNNLVGGSIYSKYSDGVYIAGDGTVNNDGSIKGSTGIYISGTADITNTGCIKGGWCNDDQAAIYLESGGKVTNQAGGSISGYYGIKSYGDTTVSNAGCVSGNTAILIECGNGNVTNLAGGSISGSYSGVRIYGDGKVTNSGYITASDSECGTAVSISGTGTVVNNSTGSISSYDHYYSTAVSIGNGTVSNYGCIDAYAGEGGNTGVKIVCDGTVNNYGYINAYGNSESCSNNYGVYIGGSGTVNNAGSISAYCSDGHNYGVYIEGCNGVVNNTGCITAYNAEAGNTGVYLNSGTVINSGHISATNGFSNTGVHISGCGTVLNTCSIEAYDDECGKGVYIGGTGTVDNFGNIFGDTYGVEINGDNSVVNAASGRIAGCEDAIDLNGSCSTVNVFGQVDICGIMEGNDYCGPYGNHSTYNNHINFDVISTPAQIAAFKAYTSTSGISELGNFTFTFGDKTVNYAWQDFASLTNNSISLEELVGPDLMGAAIAIDNGGLPPNLSGPLAEAAAGDPNGALGEFVGLEFDNAWGQILLTDVTNFLDLADGRDFTLRSGTGGFDFSGLNVQSGSLIASLGQTDGILGKMMGSSLVSGTTMSTDAKEMAPVAESNRWGAWASGTVTLADQSNTPGASGYNATTGNPTIGADYRITHDLALGALFSYSSTGADFSDSSRLGVQNELLGVYGTWGHDAWYVNGLVGGGLAQYDDQRATLGGSMAQSSPSGTEILAGITGGYDFKVGDGWRVSPEVGLQYTHLEQDAFTESGAGGFDLSEGDQNIDSLRTKLGFRITDNFSWDHIKFTPQFHAAWYHECLDDSHGVSTSLTGAPAVGSFIVHTTEAERDFAIVGAGLSATPAELGDNVTLFANYDAQVGQSDYIAHTFNGGIRFGF